MENVTGVKVERKRELLNAALAVYVYFSFVTLGTRQLKFVNLTFLLALRCFGTIVKKKIREMVKLKLAPRECEKNLDIVAQRTKRATL